MQALLDIEDESQIGDARRRVGAYITEWQISPQVDATAALVTTELATNLLRHAGGGTMYLQRLECFGESVLEVLAVDHGPGMEDVSKCLRDGYSTRGTPGTGLGAVRRLSIEFDAYSVLGQGSVVMSRMGTSAAAAASQRQPMQYGAYSTPARGETVSGDAWRSRIDSDSWSFLVADGLGHGPMAAEAAQAVAGAFEQSNDATPVAILEAAHRRASGTRGAAAAVAQVNLTKLSASFAGIGNITSRQLIGDREAGMISQNGTVGLQIRQLKPFNYEWQPTSTLLMYSDGIQARATIDAYPAVLSAHPSILAALIARDFTRGSDDVTVVAARART